MARILVIDDNEAVRTLIRIVLVGMGHSVVEACDGAEGLALYPGTAPDLVITDMVMPNKCGIEVVRTLRAKNPRAKIIAVSGGALMDPDNTLHAAQLAGASRILAKPFGLRLLTDTVNAVLQTGAANAPEEEVRQESTRSPQSARNEVTMAAS